MQQFMGSEFSFDADKALFHIIPAPLEESVSYGKGTAKAPDAIIEASQQLEKWDGFSIPGERGIYTKHLGLGLDGKKAGSCAEELLGLIEKEVLDSILEKHIPIVLGGEHTVSLGAFRAINSSKSPYKGKTGIIQFDAHGDLRDEYDGNKLSHACVMRRAFDLGFPVFQIGVRSISLEELDFRKNNKINYIDAYQAVTENINKIKLPDDFPENIYVTIDVDGFDISVFPATGTPEPGGLGWYQVLSIIESVAAQRKIIGFDVVELAPQEALHASEFAAARLVYNLMGIIERKLS
ncbi:MAG: agmatinase [Spirochaetaceae bacterium]|nr:agmatinase [Spirochaetaceae bacterium]